MPEIIERWKEEGDNLVVQRQQNGLAEHADYCRARANEGLHGPAADFKLKASIPAIVVEHYCTTNGITLREFLKNKEHIRRIVNDPALADFRIAPGRM